MRFSDYLDKHKISMKQAARELGTLYENVRKWKRGISIPRKEMMLKIEKWSRGKVKANDFYKQKVEELREERENG